MFDVAMQELTDNGLCFLGCVRCVLWRGHACGGAYGGARGRFIAFVVLDDLMADDVVDVVVFVFVAVISMLLLLVVVLLLMSLVMVMVSR